MIYLFVAVVIVGIVFLIIYNIRAGRKKQPGNTAVSQDTSALTGSTDPARAADPSSFDPASLENAAAVGAVQVQDTRSTPVEDAKASERGELDSQYRDALRRFAAEGSGDKPKSDDKEEAISADSAYRNALRSIGKKP